MKVFNLTDISDKPRQIGLAAYKIVVPGGSLDVPEYLRHGSRIASMVSNGELALDDLPAWYVQKKNPTTTAAPAKKKAPAKKAAPKKAAPKKEAAPKKAEDPAPKKTTKKSKKAKK